MKRSTLLIAFMAALLCQSINAWSQQKIALLVGIGRYEDTRSWKNLSSPNDLKYLNDALLQQGFIAENIQTLKEEAATYKAILEALVDLADKSNKGDIVYFHFSGHGQQIEDDNGDEADGYDEALVPYNARGKFDPVN